MTARKYKDKTKAARAQRIRTCGLIVREVAFVVGKSYWWVKKNTKGKESDLKHGKRIIIVDDSPSLNPALMVFLDG